MNDEYNASHYNFMWVSDSRDRFIPFEKQGKIEPLYFLLEITEKNAKRMLSEYGGHIKKIENYKDTLKFLTKYGKELQTAASPFIRRTQM